MIATIKKKHFQFHNLLAERAAHFASYAFTLGLNFVFEQPLSSLLFDYDPVRAVLWKCKAVRVSFSMHGFGSPSRKMMALWGTPSWLKSLSAHAAWLGGSFACNKHTYNFIFAGHRHTYKYIFADHRHTYKYIFACHRHAYNYIFSSMLKHVFQVTESHPVCI